MKKNKNLEMKIYELLGVKIFRKIAFSLASIISLPKKRKMTKELFKYDLLMRKAMEIVTK